MNILYHVYNDSFEVKQFYEKTDRAAKQFALNYIHKYEQLYLIRKQTPITEGKIWKYTPDDWQLVKRLPKFNYPND